MRPFRDRRDAGRRLAEKVGHLAGQDPVVVGLPRGGVPVAAEVARVLDAPLDVIVVRKLGVPHQPELGMGAIGEGGVRVLNDELIRVAGIGPEEIARVEARERVELERRAQRFRGDRPPIPLAGRTVIVVDDGIATGGTARAALAVARAHGAARVVLAVPVAAQASLRELAAEADEVLCVEAPPAFFAIGEWYADFAQTSDDEVVSLLARPPAAVAGAAADPPDPVGGDEEVELPAGDVTLSGQLTVPAGASACVVFVHGSGSSRHSPRNRLVAGRLHEAGFATLLFDLLTSREELQRANVFDVELLASRLDAVTRWLATRPEVEGLPLGYFGASTGAAAALWAAGDPGSPVGAVVSRGGRPDLAGPRLGAVRAPTLLIVGGHDEVVLDLNRQAAARLSCEHRLEVVRGATHLFEEPGALETVATLAARWFRDHLARGVRPAA